MTEWVPLSQVAVHVLPCLCLTLGFELLLGEFAQGESQGQGGLVGCHLWDRTEL